MESNLNFLCNPTLKIFDATNYTKIIGSLLNLTNTSTNIFFALVHCVKKMCSHGHSIKYMTKSNWEGYATNRKSTSCFYFSLGSDMISWLSKKQFCVELSTTKEDDVVAFLANCELFVKISYANTRFISFQLKNHSSNISKITNKKKSQYRNNIYPRKPSRGRKPNKNSSV